MTTTTSTTTIATTNTKPFVRDPQNDNKKCSNPGSANRLFKLSGTDATETNCQYECEKTQSCVAFSGIWGSWCIGCKIALSTYHDGAIAFRKGVKKDRFFNYLFGQLALFSKLGKQLVHQTFLFRTRRTRINNTNDHY